MWKKKAQELTADNNLNSYNFLLQLVLRLIYINEDSERREVDRGVAQRNRALVEIVKLKLDTNGALYFADDDNTYDAAFLNQIRWVKTVGVFNVGLIAGLPFEAGFWQS